MNAERLLAHFERISEAPDAIARLRRFILDLAVRGKLVEQDPEDEPVEDLLQRIAVEMTSRRSTRARSTPDERVEGWCSIPASWNFVRLDKVCTVIMGSSPPGSTYNKTGDGVPLINGPVEFTPGPFGRTTINQYTTDPSAFCELGDFLVCVRGSTTGRTNIAAFRACIGRGVAAIQPLFEDKFIRLAIRVRQEAILQMGRGIAFPSISRDQLSGLPVPLPPLAEQHRIVAKVDELMALCDQLEAARQKREQGRERLLASTLQRLNQPAADPASFRNDASFALQVLPSLTTTPAQIKQLRQTILNLAVRGKLVDQDPEDEPVEGYLKLIKAQPIDQGDFGTPCQWAWVSVGEVSSSRLGKMLDKAKNKGTERPYLRNINVRWLDFDLSDLLEMRFEESELSEYELKKGDVLICEGGEPGRAAVWDDRVRGVYFQKAIHRVRFDECVDPFFFVHVLWCSALDERLSRYFTGTGISHFTGKSLKGYLFPLPPLAEQHRIVAKVDELMALCDQLEQQLSQADQQRRRLLEALLAEALGGRLPIEQEESHAAIA
jgi:type I restriction enzyme S subunit